VVGKKFLQEELLAQWIDPISEEPLGKRHRLYPTPARGANTQGSYLIYLPPSYEQNISKHFPVVYWFHAGFENARQGARAVQKYDAAIKAGAMPEVIIVLPQALPVRWYVDSRWKAAHRTSYH
jgi:enterochelin esterase-like enzyme